MSPEYLQINPHGRVPALRIENGFVLTENVAILPYIAKLPGQKRLVPSDHLEEAKCLSLIGFLSSSMHSAYGAILRPWRYGNQDEAVQAAVKQTALSAYEGYCTELDSLLRDRIWVVGEAFSVCDAYLFVFYRWGKVLGLSMETFTAWTSHTRRMLERQSVRDVLASEGIEAPI